MRAALIAAIVAAVVSASTATATTAIVITGAQIKDGSIQVKDLSSKARTAFRGQRGPRGPAGAPGGQGLTGAPGAQGPAGPAGANGGFNPAKVVFRVGPATTIVGGSVLNVLTATCATGETAIAGGFFSDIGYAYNDGPAGDRVTWEVYIDAFDYGINGTGEAYVVCAAA
jgi:hypothetical protein